MKIYMIIMKETTVVMIQKIPMLKITIKMNTHLLLLMKVVYTHLQKMIVMMTVMNMKMIMMTLDPITHIKKIIIDFIIISNIPQKIMIMIMVIK